MSSYRDAFPSRFLRATDIPDEGLVVTIEEVLTEAIGDDEQSKLVVAFSDVKKRLPLNITNADSIAAITGTDDYEKWPGHQVKLVKARVDFRGQRVDAIRIDPAPQPKKQTGKTEEPAA